MRVIEYQKLVDLTFALETWLDATGVKLEPDQVLLLVGYLLPVLEREAEDE